MDFPAVFPWEPLPEVTNANYDPFTISTILTIAATRDLSPNITEHLARIVLKRIRELSIEFEGHLTKAQATIAARKRVAEEAVKLDCSAYLPQPLAQASHVQTDLILGIIEEEIGKSSLRGPTAEEADAVENEIRTVTGGNVFSYVEEPKGNEEPSVKVEEVVENGRHVHKFVFSPAMLDKNFDGKDPYAPIPAPIEQLAALNLNENECSPSTFAEVYKDKDILTALCSSVELAVELGKHLTAHEILNVYIASPTFRSTINNYMLSSVRIWIDDRCPEAGRVFPFTMYKKYLIPDPTGRTWGDIYKDAAPANLSAEKRENVRTIPGMKYLQLVLGRDKYVREIVAIMARSGHLFPKSMYNTLLRIWLLMDVTTTPHRRLMLRNKKLWTDQDLYNAQMFFVKLTMHMNDPVYGPSSTELMNLFMGQRGLYRLWQLLLRKRFTTLREIVDLNVRYDYHLDNEQWQRCTFRDGYFHDVPLSQVGKFHLNGYGTMGLTGHLFRPDELIPYEAAARGLQLERHIRHMIIWGYFDRKTGKNIVPTEEQMYISDEEETLAHMDKTHHWRKKHAMKKRWDELTEEQQQEIRDEDEDETLRCQAWSYWGEQDDENPDLDDCEPDTDAESEYSLNDEIHRGYCVPEQPKDKKSEVPESNDKKGWEAFITNVLIGAPPQLDFDWMQRLVQNCKVNDKRYDERFDWRGWMESEDLDPDNFLENDEN